MVKISLKTLKNQAQKEIEKVKDLKELNEIFKKYLGKQGRLTQILRSLKDLPEKERKKEGRLANQIKREMDEAINLKKSKIQYPISNIQDEWLDITAPGKKLALGHLHPLTLVRRKIEEIFQNMGFSVVEGPEIESEWYNFDALNIPKDHPARDMWDTLWLKDPKLLMRAHTSPVQIRYIEKNQPPIKILVPGRVFRHEATDARHEINFYQVEGLMIGDRGKVSAANFKAVIEDFFSKFFGKKITTRLRPGYFPFVEPGFEIDISCFICGGKGCPTCKNSGWIETMGAGMVHPSVLKNSGLNPKFFQGFAFGMGMDRLAMMKYKINDIRLFYSGDLRFLQQF